MKRDHSENFLCDLCDKVCTTKIDLKRHQLTHKADSEKPYQCDQCDRGFVMNHQLKVRVLFNYSIVHNLLSRNVVFPDQFGIFHVVANGLPVLKGFNMLQLR